MQSGQAQNAKMQAEVGKMEKQLQRWGANLDDLAAQAKAAGEGAMAEERRVLDDLREKQRVAQKRLDELKADGGDKWDTLKGGVESAYGELETAFKKMKK